MRCQYRETVYECGDYLEANIYPVYSKGISRAKKRKATPECQQKLNEKNSERKLIRLANTNFTEKDLKIELTYSPKHNPETDDEANRQLRNFLRRVKRYRDSHGLTPLKYIAVTERGRKKGRYHHHIIMSGEISLYDLVQLWGLGIVGTDMLQFNENGLADLVIYMMKQPRNAVNEKRYTRSRNLVEPEPRQRDGRIIKREAVELAKDTENVRAYEKLYDGYHYAGAQVVMNDVNGGVYIYARYYRKEAAFCNQKKTLNRSHSSAGRTSCSTNTRN